MLKKFKWYIGKWIYNFTNYIYETIEIFKFLFILGIILLPFSLIFYSIRENGLGMQFIICCLIAFFAFKLLMKNK